MFDLTGKVAMITGAARGQGAAEARLFRELGATVVLTDVLEEEGQDLAEELGGGSGFHRLDAVSSQDWHRVVSAVVEAHGRLDVLVNNAGILRTDDLEEWAEDDLRHLLDVNLVGALLGMQAVLPRMPSGGSIVNIASISALRGHAGGIPYATSKWGLRGASRSAALEFAPRGIRVNCVCPGSVDTPMVAGSTFDPSTLPIPRKGTAEEVAYLVAYLASDVSAYCTGADFVIDGGATA